MNRQIATFTASAGAALALAACGGDDDARVRVAAPEPDRTALAGKEVRVTGERPQAARPGARQATVGIGEWYFKVDQNRLRSGTVTLVVRNEGQLEHEFLMVKTKRPADHLPMGDEGPDLERAGKVVVGEMHGHGDEPDDHGDEMAESSHGDEVAESSHGDEMAESSHGDEVAESSEAAEKGHLAAGESRRYRVKLRPGRYVLLCSIPGHYKAGQYASLTVQ